MPNDISTINNYYLKLINNIEEGILIFDKDNGNIHFFNSAATKLLHFDDASTPQTIYDIFPKELSSKLTDGFTSEYSIAEHKIFIKVIQYLSALLLFVSDVSLIVTQKDQINNLLQLNKDVVSLYEQYSNDTIGIINSDGTIEFTGDIFASNCGLSVSDLIGKNVRDLEEQQIFSPSVTLKVLNSKKTELVMQKTKTGAERICIGSPVFDDSGNITKIISITKDYLHQLEIGQSLSKNTNNFSLSNNNTMKDASAFSTCSPGFISTIQLARIVSETDVTVLITGETGVGKEVMATFVQQHSARKDSPFIKVNCGAISPNLVESELFGYEPGSFTGARHEGKTGLIEAANGGTLFLDEISELPLDQQIKLLRTLEEKQILKVGATKSIDVDVRIIVASNKPLDQQVAKGLFREDLYYRLNIVPLIIPPLRNRPEDIPLLTEHFLQLFNQQYNKNVVLAENVSHYLKQYSWPGNVRELKSAIERLVIINESGVITVNDLPLPIKTAGVNTSNIVVLNDIVPLKTAVEEVERTLIQRVLTQHKTAKEAAVILDVSQSTMSRKIKEYNL